MKVVFPDTNDYRGKEEQFFDQMELSLYHAKKSWEKMKKKNPRVTIHYRANGEIALVII